MKYKITRTNQSSFSLVRPHEDAIVEDYIYIDRRTVATLKEGEEKGWYKQWYNRGYNHRVERGMIACDVKYRDGKSELFTRWVIEIENLQKWVEELEINIVLQPKSYDNAIDPLMEIEIYDGWRE